MAGYDFAALPVAFNQGRGTLCLVVHPSISRLLPDREVGSGAMALQLSAIPKDAVRGGLLCDGEAREIDLQAVARPLPVLCGEACDGQSNPSLRANLV